VKVLVSWLRELVDVPVSAAQLARDLHMAGFEVASVEPVGTVPRAETGGTVPTDDAVIDFEITANRPDCLSLMGLAREVATRYDSARRVPAHADLGPVSPDSIEALRVTIEDAVRCPRYCAAVADVRVGPSPSWLADGSPRPASAPSTTSSTSPTTCSSRWGTDARIRPGPARGRHLRVRLAQNGEALKTLDGRQQRKLDAEMLVIADESRAQALAGVMGGADSEVSSATRTIAIESAWFLPASVRRPARHSGCRRKRHRFERGADFAAPPEGLARVCACSSRSGGDGPPRLDRCQPRRGAPRLVAGAGAGRPGAGAAVPVTEIRRILTGLGFLIGEHDDARWWCPCRRGGTTWRAMDLIEEVARHFGYDRLPTTFPALTTVPAKPERRLEVDRRPPPGRGCRLQRVRHVLVHRREGGAGVCAGGRAGADRQPAVGDLRGARPSLLPGLVDSLSHNRRHGRRDVRLFELGTRFLSSAGEHRALALGWLGASGPEHWARRRVRRTCLTSRASPKRLARRSASSLGGGGNARAVPGRTALLTAAAPDGRRASSASSASAAGARHRARHPRAGRGSCRRARSRRRRRSGHTARHSRHTAVTALPSIVRDLSILVADTLPASQLRGTIRSVAPPTLARVAEFDRYQGKGIPDGQVSLSWLTFLAPDRTLTDAEVTPPCRTVARWRRARRSKTLAAAAIIVSQPVAQNLTL
jgi:phenylalanyl-tRNA synthetase beta chain